MSTIEYVDAIGLFLGLVLFPLLLVSCLSWLIVEIVAEWRARH